MSTDNIIVAIKVRPLIEREAKLSVHWNVQGRAIIQLDLNGQPYGEPYCFDHVFDEKCTTKDVYGEVVKTYIKSAMEGFNLTIFAYGQTSSGKTYTMMGNEHSPGIIQLAVNDIFEYIKDNPERQFLISCSYFEIYNEQIFDLLAMNQKTLKVREDFSGNISIQTIETVTTTPEAVFKVMNTGNKSRKMGSTKMNQRSSRSHTIFKISITSSREKDDVTCSHLYLVDLAGSERVSQTKAEGERLKEGVNINKSLSALGNVIRQLSEQDSFVSYRDSKLTRILQPALGGNSKSLLITTITVAAGEETKSSLEFSQRAKIVKNKPVINQVKTTEDARIQEVCEQYQKRMAILQEKARKFEVERDKALSELMFLKEDLNTVMKFQQRVGQDDSTERKKRRHTLGSYHPSSEVSSLVGMQFTTPGHTKRPVFRECTTSSVSEEVLHESTASTITESDQVLRESTASTITESDQVLLESTASTITESDEVFLESKSSTTTEIGKAIAVCTPARKKSVRTLTTIHEESPPEMLELSTETSSTDFGETPAKIWRERHQRLEESFESLREYTRLEKEYTAEEGGFVRNILQEKEKLYNDLISIQALLMDERKKHSAEVYEQQAALDILKENNEKLSREFQQLEIAKASLDFKYEELKESSEVRAKNIENILEEKEKTYGNKLSYYRDRINEFHEENAKLAKSLEEMQREKLESELRLKEMHENFSKTNPETDQELLSVMTQTEDITEPSEITDNLEELKMQIEQLGRDNSELQDNYELIEFEKDQIQKELNKVSIEKNQLKKKFDEIISQSEDLKQLAKENDDLRSQINKLSDVEKGLTQEKNDLSELVEVFTDIEKQLLEKIENLEKGLSSTNDLKQQNIKLQDKNDELNDELKEKMEELNKLSESIEARGKENDYLSTEIKVYSDKEKQLQDEIKNLQRELRVMADLRQQNFILADLTSDLRRELDEKDAEIYKMSEDIKFLKEFANDVDEKKNAIEQNEKTANLQIKNQLKEISQLTREKNELIIQIAMIFETEKQLHNTINALQEELSDKIEMKEHNRIVQEIESKMQKELEEKLSEIAEMKKEFHKLDKDKIEFTTLSKKINDLNQQIEMVTKSEQRLQDKIKFFQKELCDKIDMKEHNRIVQEFKLKMEQEIEEKLSEIAEMKTKLQKRDSEMTELTKLSEENITKLEEVTRMNEDLNKERKQLISEAENMREEIENLKEVSRNHTKELEKKAKLLKIEMTTQANRLKVLTKEKDDLSSQITSYTERLDKAEIEKFKHSMEIEELGTTEKQLREKIEELNKQLSMTIVLEYQNNDLVHTNSNLEKEMNHKAGEILRLKESLKKKDAEISKLTEITKSNTDPLQISSKEKTDEIFKLKKEVTQKNEKIIKLEQENRKKSQIIKKFEGNVVQEMKELDENSDADEIKKLKDEINLLSGQIKRFESELKQNQEQNRVLQEQIREKNKKIRTLELENGEQFEKIKNLKEVLREQTMKYQTHLDEERKQLEIFSKKKVEKLPERRRRQENECDRKKKIYTLYDSRRSLSSSDDADDLQILRTDFERLQEDCHSKEQIIKLMKIELGQIRESNDHLVCKNTKLKEELNQSINFENEYRMLRLEVEYYKTDLKNAKLKLSEVPADAASEIKNELEKAKEECNKLKQSLMQKVNELKGKQKLIASLEEIKQKKYIEYVDLQTKMYDLMNEQDAQKAIYQNKILALENKVAQLKPKKGEDIVLQTDLTMVDLDKKDDKYQMTKRVANMRREENLKLRKRLGLPPDAALQ